MIDNNSTPRRRTAQLAAGGGLLLASLLLTGCPFDDKDPITAGDRIDTVAAAPADSEPTEPNAQLQTSMDNLFGPADGEPVAVNDGDTYSDVSLRASQR